MEQCTELRRLLIQYMATKHSNQITALASELGVSVPLVSRYIRKERPMSGTFIATVKLKLKGFSDACDEALKAMGEARWMNK